jgi:hypothetical protein
VVRTPRGKSGQPSAARGLGGRDDGEDGADRGGAVGGASADGPVTVPFHKLSDEADVDTRLRALVEVLVARRLVSEEELEEAVRRLMRPRDPDDPAS